jgi:hypothetical protein
MKTTEQTNELTSALAKAQGVFSNPAKEARNPHFNSLYADLASGLNSIREALSANGLAVVQAPRIDGDVLMLDTRLSHASGQWIEAEYPVCKLGVRQQEIGSAMTYARRYSLFSIVGIAGEDDDGNAGSQTAVPGKKPEERDVSAQKFYEECIDMIESSPTVATLQEWWQKGKAQRDQILDTKDHAELIAICKAKVAELKAAEASDRERFDATRASQPPLSKVRFANQGTLTGNDDDPTAPYRDKAARLKEEE